MSSLKVRPEGAKLAEKAPQFAQNYTRQKGKIKKGLVYEKLVGDLIEAQNKERELGWVVNRGPWIKYWGKKGKDYWAQPDLVLMHPKKKRVRIIEVKLSHSAKAFFQLEAMYKVLLRKILGDGWEIETLEIYANHVPMKEEGLRSSLLRWDADILAGTCGMCRLHESKAKEQLEEIRNPERPAPIKMLEDLQAVSA